MGALTLTPRLHHRERENGTRLVWIRLTKDRQSATLPAGFNLAARHWNPKGKLDKANWIRTSEPDSENLNKILEDFVRSGRATALANSALSATQVRDLLLAGGSLGVAPSKKRNKEAGKLELAQYCDDYAKQRERISPPKTAKLYYFMARHVAAWVGERALPLASVTKADLTDFYTWLLERPTIHAVTARDTLGKLCTALRHAVKENMTVAVPRPYEGFSLPAASAKKPVRRISEDERLAVMAVDLTGPAPLRARGDYNERLQVRRDMWHLQYLLRGSRIGDVLQLRKRDVQHDRISFKESKTGKTKSVLRSATINALLAPYLAGSPTDYLFPALDSRAAYAGESPSQYERAELMRALDSRTGWLNSGLAILAKRAGVESFTSHAARHMFAERAYRKLKDIRVVKDMLNHSKIETTERYLATLGIDSLDAATDSVLDD